MKNNIRYKGNTSNTSVIIFLIGSRLNKNSQRWYFAWENLQEIFVMLVVVVVVFFAGGLTFIFYLHFAVVLHSFFSSFVVVVVLHSLLSNIIPHPSMGYRQVFTPILYFQLSPLQSDLQHFHFNLSKIFFHSFTASATVLGGDFFTHWRFLPCATSPTFFDSTCVYQGLPRSRQFFPEVCRTSC